VIHIFAGYPNDGCNPYSGPILDASGNFGATFICGSFASGTLFQLTPQSSGWKETTLHNFGSGNDAEFPDTSLIFDAAGNLYGSSVTGGDSGEGGSFEVTP
jgi:hypothetical protein